MEEIKLAILGGTLDGSNPLSKLRGNALVWNQIFNEVSKSHYESHIDVKSVACLRNVNLERGQRLEFPKPTGIDINMMPIRIISRTWPENCGSYMRLLLYHCPVPRSSSVMYLTIQESLVPVGTTQRRSGLHIERPGSCGRPRVVELPLDGYFGSEYHDICWGLGYCDKKGLPVDGIYFASNVADSSRVYDALIDRPEEVTDAHGGIEPMRKYLGEGHTLKANEVCWITDRTPHESLPVRAPDGDPTATHVYRQFVRLVVGDISVWYSKHNTPNPTGLQPAAPISDEDKFSELAEDWTITTGPDETSFWSDKINRLTRSLMAIISFLRSRA